MGISASEKRAIERTLAVFGGNVARARQRIGPTFTRRRLAAVTRLHLSEIERIELGRTDVRLTTLVIRADGLGTSIGDLLAGAPVPRRDPRGGSTPAPAAHSRLPAGSMPFGGESAVRS